VRKKTLQIISYSSALAGRGDFWDLTHEEDMATRKLALESADVKPELVKSEKSKSWLPMDPSKSCSAICVTEPSNPKLLKLRPRFDGVIVFDDAQPRLLADEVLLELGLEELAADDADCEAREDFGLADLLDSLRTTGAVTA
jgi:hypothetical protein